LHKKPTLIRTLDPAMRDALDLQCTGDHRHELVQGKATAPSATYSKEFAEITAKIILRVATNLRPPLRQAAC
jgi:hypothetical protein